MKFICYMLNMVVPGAGLLILKKSVKGVLLSLFSLIAWGLIVPGLIRIIKIMNSWTNMYDIVDGDPADLEGGSNQFKEIAGDNLLLIIGLGIIGVIILKVTLIWSQAATVRAFKEKKESEDQSLANPEVPFIDSSN